MSEYDRGAYTPPTDESFAFDARPAQVRRPVPATLLGSLVVLVVLVGAVAVFYWSGVRGAGEAPRVVGKPQLQIKTPPPVDAKPISDDDKLDVYDEEKGQTPPPAPAKTNFAPPPEQPQPRPIVQAQAAPAAVQSAPLLNASPQNTPPQNIAPQKTAPQQTPPQSASAKPASASSAVAAAQAPRPEAAPALRRNDAVSSLLARNEPRTAPAAKPSPPARAEAAPTDAARGVMVQIGAFSSAAIADEQFAKTKAAFASFTGGKAKHVERAEVGGKVYWRTAFAGFDRPGAKAFCRALIAAKKGCIVR